jgi:ferrochelatase
MHFGGRSPINDQNRELIAALSRHLEARGTPLPVYWGNRNWHPYLADTLKSMRADGVRRAVAFATSAYSSFSGCRQYLTDIETARAAVGPGAPEVAKLRPYFNHPGFVQPLAEGLRAARAQAGPAARVLMTAHSIPTSMAAQCDYEHQLGETGRLVSEAAGEDGARWSQVYQSRSGPPDQPWLGPDVGEAIAALPEGTESVIVVPIGFVSDHMEVVYDLDTQAAATAAARGIKLVRTATPGTHPAFVEMVGQLVDELDRPESGVAALGKLGPRPYPCRAGCCPAPAR